MENLEKLILQSYVDTIKAVGGRGPRNIYVKIIDTTIEIHFLLVKSQLEEFIMNHFDAPEQYLHEMYSNIQACIIPRAIEDIYHKTSVLTTFNHFDIDVAKDKFCLKLDIQRNRQSVQRNTSPT